MTEALEVITKIYDFTLWAVPKINKFPRDHRFTIGERLCGMLYGLLKDAVEARYSPQSRGRIVWKMNGDLDFIRLLFRLAKDFKVMDLKGYSFAAERLDEIGRLVGGWKKALQGK